MPIRKNPCTLFEISLVTYVKHFVTEWIFSVQRIGQELGSEIINQHIHIPSTIANVFVSEALKKYIALSRNNGEDIPDICVFLERVLVSQLTVLDLSNLIHLGNRHSVEFENVIISKLPQFSNLVSISLHTHGEEVTLPVCTDQILMQIGKHCHELKYLDISNNGVSFDGMRYLVPGVDNIGCPLLLELYIFECNLTLDDVAFLLEGLPSIHVIGHKEIGLVVMILHQYWKKNKNNKNSLELTHLNNVGTMENQKRPSIYKFSENLSSIVNKLCPKLYNLKIRVSDSDVARFKHFPSLTSVEFIYNVCRPSSPGEGTLQFFKLHATQLSNIAIICDQLHEKYIMLLGDHCINLKGLWLRCNNFIPANESLVGHTHFSRLVSFYFRIGETSETTCLFPSRVLGSILSNTHKLEELKIALRSISVNDKWLSHLITSINTLCLKQLWIALPCENKFPGALDLSMASVHMILKCIPNLKTLGNLFVWNVNPEEVRALQYHLSLSNFDVNVYYNSIKSR